MYLYCNKHAFKFQPIPSSSNKLHPIFYGYDFEDDKQVAQYAKYQGLRVMEEANYSK